VLHSIDLHCHVLPGLDDGPATYEEAIALARGAHDDGIATIAATPHVDWSRPSVDSSRIHVATGELQARLEAAGVPVTIVPGAEVAAGRALELADAELRGLSLGGSGWLLLECPLMATLAPGFVEAARILLTRGHRVLLAHPERSPIFLRSPELLTELVAEGMLTQITAGALNRRYGRTVREFAMRLMDRGAVHVIASDGHGRNRPARIGRELEMAGVEARLAAWYTQAVPAALLADRKPPPRPDVAPRHRRERLLRLVGR
jgi:protein-tyrosine phosphatase